ncbi:MAG: dihydroorotate dehydrogenase [Deltaproteobacteria bacterium]|nr:dihydroorotate dehydrogenase [Deltaproteobacteria bacterium]
MTANPDISVNIGPLKLSNPVMTASGTFGYGKEFEPLFDLNQLGAIIVKGISLKPMAGNPPPRIVETPCGMLNAIGLANIGIEGFLKDKLPWLSTLDTKVIVNIYGHSISEYGELASALRGAKGISAIEVNISCPNVDKGGLVFGKDPEVSARVTETVVKHSDKPVIVKLTPNVSDITLLAKAVEQAGAHALSVINTLTGMAIDINTKRPRLGNLSGGLSGPAIKPVALFMVYQTAKAVKIPVIGIGGILNAEDALEFMIAGASAVQVGTANFINPMATIEIVKGIRDYCLENGIERVSDLTGTLITARQV